MPTPTHQPTKLALCYIRQSYTRDANDMTSPERQRTNIQRVLEQNGWQALWFEDVDGHKSGRTVKNRPGWLALMERLNSGHGDVLIANDLSRLHRKGWRVGDLIDHLERHNVDLVIAEPGREVDTSTPMGRMFIYFTAMFDEYYSEDIAQRAKASIQHRKQKGVTVGMMPFGTERDKEGYLQPSSEGAWVLADGCWAAGEVGEEPPEEDAEWRGYFEAAVRMLELYRKNQRGLERIAYQMHEEGWAFRERTGKPRPINREDVRRVIANWPEYGGIVTNNRSKDRLAYEQSNFTKIPFVEERAVMDLGLLQEVARVRHVRSVRPEMGKTNKNAHRYPLSNITYCAHCEQMARKHDNPKLRTHLTGTNMNGTLRYRHKAGVSCGTKAKSVKAEQYEADFTRLIYALAVKPDVYELMMSYARQLDEQRQSATKDVATERRREINLRKRRIEAAINLYKDGVMSREEYLERVETAERELAFWEGYETEVEEAQIQLQTCLKSIQNLVMLWDMASSADRQRLVRNIFSYVVYNLDTQRIVDFRLQPWADHFLVLRASLSDEDGNPQHPDDDGVEERENAPHQVKRHMPPRGFEPLFQP